MLYVRRLKNPPSSLFIAALAVIASACSPQINAGFKTFARNIASANSALIWSGATSINAGACSEYTITNELGNVPTPVSANTSVNLSDTGSGIFYSNSSCSTAATSLVIPAGSSSQTVYFLAASAQSLLLEGSSSASSSPLFSVTILDVATKLSFSTEPSSTESSGSPLATQPVTQVQDSLGHLISSATSSVTLAAFTDSACTIAASGTLTASINPRASVAGVASFSNLTYTGTTGTIYIKASSSGLTSACSTAIAVTAATASQLAFTTEPSSTESSGVALSTQPTVQVEDALGNLVSSATNSITLAPFTDSACTVSASGTLTATTNPLSASSGIANFAAVTYAGSPTTLYLKASSSGLTSACSSAITLSAGAASKLMFSTEPSSTANSGTAFSTQPTVHVDDASGNLVSSATNSITLAAFTDSACTVAAAGTFTATTNPLSASSGSAAFTAVTYSGTTGTIYLKASASGLTAACSTSIVLSAGTASKLFYSTEPSSSGSSGLALSTQPTLQIEDAAGNLVSSATNSITLSAFTDSACTTAASGTFTATSNPLAASSGSATFSGVTYTGSAGSIYIKAAASGLTSACSTVIAFSAGVATKVVFTTEPSSTEDSGSALTTQPVVQIEDSSGNLVSSATNSITLSAFTDSGCTTAASGSLSATSNPLSASSGSASFSGVTYTGVLGTIYLKASTSGLTTACSTAIVLSAGTASKLVFQPNPSNTESAGEALAVQPVIKVEDASGNLNSSATNSITLAAFTDSACTTSASGTLTATTNPLAASSGSASFAGVTYTGSATTIYLQASASGLTSACSSAILVRAGAASKLIFSTEPSSTESSGAALATQPVIQIQDSSNNLVSTATNSITLASFTDSACTTAAGGSLSATTNPLSASSGAASFAAVTYTGSPTTIYLKASASGLTSACSSAIVVSVGSATQLVFSTQPSSTENSGSALSGQPAIQVEDASGTLVSSATNSVTLAAFTDSACTSAATGTFAATTNPLSASSGSASFAGVTYTGSAGTIYLKATASGLTSACSSAIVVSAGSPTKLVFSTEPSTTEASGAALTTQPVLQVEDAFNNLSTSATNSITLSAFTDSACTSSASGTLTATTNPINAASGIASFAGVTYTGPSGGSIYVQASALGLSSACSSAIAISTGAAAKLAFTTQPSRAAPGASLGSVAVTVEDSGGNTVTSSNASITLAIGNNPGPSGVLSGTTTVSAVSGVATFPGLSISIGGAGYTLTASASSLTTATSASFVVTLTYQDQYAYTPNAPGTSQAQGTAVDSSGNLYVVGSTEDGSGTLHWIVRKYNGSSWSVVDNFQYVSGAASAANAITIASSGNMYVAGYGYDGSGIQHWVVREFSAGNWSTVDDFVYSGLTQNAPTSVAVNNSGTVFVTGTSTGTSTHWVTRESVAGSWSTIDDYVYPSGISGTGQAVSLDPTGIVYAVGSGQDSSFATHWITREYQAGSWSTIDDYEGDNGGTLGAASAVTSDLSGTIYVGGYAVGSNGNLSWQVRMYSGGSWSTIDDYQDGTGIEARVSSLITDSSGKVYAAGTELDGSGFYHWLVRVYSSGSWTNFDDFQYNTVAYGSDSASALAIDSSGNVYSAGSAVDSNSNLHWLVRKFNGSSWSTLDDYQEKQGDSRQYGAVSADLSGNLYASGIGMDNSGSVHWIVREFTNGSWSTIDDYQHPGSLYTEALGTASDLSGNIFVTGFTEEPNGAPGHWIVREYSGGSWSTVDDYVYPSGEFYTEPSSMVSDSAGNIFVTGAGYDQNYNLHWITREFTGGSWSTVDDYSYVANGFFTQGSAIAADGSGHVFAAGVGYDNSFAVHWIVREFSSGSWSTIDDYQYSTDYPEPYAMTVDSSGNVYVAGVAENNNANYHWLVREYTGGSWNLIDDYQYNSSTTCYPASMTVDASGNVYAAGIVNDTNNVSHGIIREYSSGSWSSVLDYQLSSGNSTSFSSIFYLPTSQEIIWGGNADDNVGNRYWVVHSFP